MLNQFCIILKCSPKFIKALSKSKVFGRFWLRKISTTNHWWVCPAFSGGRQKLRAILEAGCLIDVIPGDCDPLFFSKRLWCVNKRCFVLYGDSTRCRIEPTWFQAAAFWDYCPNISEGISLLWSSIIKSHQLQVYRKPQSTMISLRKAEAFLNFIWAIHSIKVDKSIATK